MLDPNTYTTDVNSNYHGAEMLGSIKNQVKNQLQKMFIQINPSDNIQSEDGSPDMTTRVKKKVKKIE